MSGFIKWILKTAVAGIAAYFVLGLFSLIYYNISTFPKLPFYMQASEGFGYGTLNKDGRMSHLDLPNNNEYSVVVMGSSHVDAIQIPQTKTVSYLLNEKIGGLGVYTKSENAYYLLSQIRDFSSVVEEKNPKYVIMETGNIDFNSESINTFLDDDLSTSAAITDAGVENKINSQDIIRNIKMLPYIRLLTVQRGNLVNQKNTSANTSFSPATQEQLDLLLQTVSAKANSKSVNLIIYYHPRLLINEGGAVTSAADPEKLQQFTAACANSGVSFIDMTDVFLDAYKTSYIFPHGFSNTPIGTGHMNAYGHEMVADELAKAVLEMEGKS